MADEWGQATEVDYDVDTSGIGADDLSGGEGLIDKEGWYHLEIVEVKRELDTLSDKGKPRSPHVRFDMVVLQSVDKQSPAGCRHFHKGYVAGPGGEPISDGSRKNLMRFGVGLGLLKVVEKDGQEIIVNAETGLTKIPLSMWDKAKNMQIIAPIKLKKGDANYGDSYEIPFGRVKQVDDPTVADVPKNAEALAMIGKANVPGAVKPGEKAPSAKAPPAGGGEKKEKAPPAEKKQAAPPPDDDISDL